MGARAICPTDCCRPVRSGRCCASCGATRAARPKRARCSTRCARCTTGESPLRRARCGLSPESELLVEALARARAPVARARIASPCAPGWTSCSRRQANLLAAGTANLPTAQRETLRRLGARRPSLTGARVRAVAIATAQDDEHELELIAAWCRAAARTRSAQPAAHRRREAAPAAPPVRTLAVADLVARPNGWPPSARAVLDRCSPSKAVSRSPNSRSSRMRC